MVIYTLILAGAALTIFFAATGHFLRAAGVAAIVLAIVGWRRYSPGRFAAYALLTVALTVGMFVAAAAAFDVYLHHRYFRAGGYNVRGYRGNPVGAKKSGERRLVMLGGSVAFGYGVDVDETIPAYLQQILRDRTVINLACNSEGAYAFHPTLDDYAGLQYDQAILYSGYNDLSYHNRRVFRHESPIFLLTGYLPILPVIPINAWLRVRDLSQVGQTVFEPTLADRSSTQWADTANRVQRTLNDQLARFAKEAPRPQASGDNVNECGARWSFYCQAVREGVVAGRRHGAEVFVVTEPYVYLRSNSEEERLFHVRQQAALASAVTTWFAGDPLVHYVNLGRAVDLTDASLCYDGLHLTAKGNRQLAEALAVEIRRLSRSVVLAAQQSQ